MFANAWRGTPRSQSGVLIGSDVGRTAKCAATVGRMWGAEGLRRRGSFIGGTEGGTHSRWVQRPWFRPVRFFEL